MSRDGEAPFHAHIYYPMPDRARAMALRQPLSEAPGVVFVEDL